MTPDKFGTHIEHCCSIHGCKYGDDMCPVANGIEQQTYPCESCDIAIEEMTNNINSIMNLIEVSQNIKVKSNTELLNFLKSYIAFNIKESDIIYKFFKKLLSL
jgi:hypothetical protein